MSKSIYDEAINDVENLHKCLGDKTSRDISAKNLLQTLKQAQKQEKLLVFYKDLAEVRKEIHDLIVILKKPKDERLKILFTQEYVISNHIRRLEE